MERIAKYNRLLNKWQIAAVLIIIERSGKAIRTPGKDTMLSHAAKRLGTGFGFAIIVFIIFKESMRTVSQ